jgi:hypothetical protein
LQAEHKDFHITYACYKIARHHTLQSMQSLSSFMSTVMAGAASFALAHASLQLFAPTSGEGS